MICPGTKDELHFTNLTRLPTHFTVHVHCTHCGWREQVNLSLHGHASTGYLRAIHWAHAMPVTQAPKKNEV